MALRAVMIVAQPRCSRARSAASCGETSQKNAGWQLGQVGQEPGHAAGGVVLGQPVGGGHVREHLGSGLVPARLVPVLPVPDDLPDRVVLLAVEQVAERGFLRLVMGGQRAVGQPRRSEQPCLAVGLHDERISAGDRVHAGRPRRRPVIGGRSATKSGTSAPVQRRCSSSHQTSALRSLHGLPSGSADARLYSTRRFAGQAQPQSGATQSCCGHGVRRAAWLTPPARTPQ